MWHRPQIKWWGKPAEQRKTLGKARKKMSATQNYAYAPWTAASGSICGEPVSPFPHSAPRASQSCQKINTNSKVL